MLAVLTLMMQQRMQKLDDLAKRSTEVAQKVLVNQTSAVSDHQRRLQNVQTEIQRLRVLQKRVHESLGLDSLRRVASGVSGLVVDTGA